MQISRPNFGQIPWLFPQRRAARKLNGEHLARAVPASQLRLVELQDQVLKHTSFNPDLRDHGKPRLWLDDVTNIVMEPDRRTYRLETENGKIWQTLFETRDPNEMLEKLQSYAGRATPQQSAVSAGPPWRKPLNWIDMVSLAVLAIAVLAWIALRLA